MLTFRPYFASFFQKSHLAFWCYVINLSAVYSQRLETGSLKISKFENFDLLSENMDHATMEAIAKYIKHPNLIAIALKFTKE